SRLSQEPEDVKPRSTSISRTDDGTKITVLVRRDTKFSKVFQAAEVRCMRITSGSKKFGKEPGAYTYGKHVQVTYEGKRIQKEETPAEVSMEDGDTIDAHLGQVGGGHP
ncbi:hypothetical protein F5146DRAFT_1039585, partial [Armillaria mellea]